MEQNKTSIEQSDFGNVNGKQVYLFTFRNTKGSLVKVTNYGGTLTSWVQPNKDGKAADIVLGFDNIEDYLKPQPYLGAIVGRYANRIAKGKFELDGTQYTLAVNNEPNHLHGGIVGFDKVVWDAEISGDTLVLKYTSVDGEEGYPGNVELTVRYHFSEEDALSIRYEATTDKATPLNLTSHGYFNLTGDMDQKVLNHDLIIDADAYTPVDAGSIPTGVLQNVMNTIFDFRKLKTVGADFSEAFEGYDHNYVLNGKGSLAIPAAVLSEKQSGFELAVYTTEPGMQLYTGIFLDGTSNNKDGKAINQYSGICLETQHFPDSPNQSHFPNTILRPGETFQSETIYKLGLMK